MKPIMVYLVNEECISKTSEEQPISVNSMSSGLKQQRVLIRNYVPEYMVDGYFLQTKECIIWKNTWDAFLEIKQSMKE